MPALVQQNGLCLAVAFLESKAKKPEGESKSKPEYARFLGDLQKVVGLQNLAKMSREAEILEYLRLTETVMRAAVYFKRYAEAVLKVDPTDDDDRRNG